MKYTFKSLLNRDTPRGDVQHVCFGSRNTLPHQHSELHVDPKSKKCSSSSPCKANTRENEMEIKSNKKLLKTMMAIKGMSTEPGKECAVGMETNMDMMMEIIMDLLQQLYTAPLP